MALRGPSNVLLHIYDTRNNIRITLQNATNFDPSDITTSALQESIMAKATGLGLSGLCNPRPKL